MKPIFTPIIFDPFIILINITHPLSSAETVMHHTFEVISRKTAPVMNNDEENIWRAQFT
jgi:hypothetical protein